jgi:transcriptional regulator with XRE-family HTH domain
VTGPAGEVKLSTRSFGDQLNRLIQVVHGRGLPPLSNKELAEAVQARGVRCTPQYIGQLRADKHAPSLEMARALAQVFGVPIDYFNDPGIARSADEQLTRLAAVQDAGVTRIALRAAGLSPRALEALHEVIDRIRAEEGLPSDSQEHKPYPASDNLCRRRMSCCGNLIILHAIDRNSALLIISGQERGHRVASLIVASRAYSGYD